MMKKLVYALIIVLAIGGTGCVYISAGIRGNGIPEKRTFDVKEFENIMLIGGMEAVIVQGDEYKVEVELDGNLYDVFDAHVSHSTLRIGFTRGASIRGYRTYNVHIQLPSLVSVDSTGSADVTISGFTDAGKEMNISQTGSGTISVDVVLRKLEIEAAGSGTVTAKGSAEILSFNGRGSGALKAFELQSEQVNIEQSGSGNIAVAVKNSLQADLAGSGHLRYKGSPSRIIIRSSGSAKVEQAE